jgi:outer membrane protein X
MMMKKLLSVIIKSVAITVIALLMVNVAATAQEKGDMAAGANVVLGAGDNVTNFGLGAKLQYNILKPVRVEGAFNYFFEKDLVNMWDLSLNAHYLFSVSDRITVYPLAGVGVLGVKVNLPTVDLGGFGSVGDDVSNNDFGVNLGGGIDFKLSEKLIFNVQAKYMLAGEWGRLIASAGIAFRF